MEESQMNVLLEAIRKIVRDETKSEVKEIKEEFQNEIGEIKQEIKNIKEEFQNKMGEIKQEIKNIKEEFQNEIGEIKQEIRSTKQNMEKTHKSIMENIEKERNETAKLIHEVGNMINIKITDTKRENEIKCNELFKLNKINKMEHEIFEKKIERLEMV